MMLDLQAPISEEQKQQGGDNDVLQSDDLPRRKAFVLCEVQRHVLTGARHRLKWALRSCHGPQLVRVNAECGLNNSPCQENKSIVPFERFLLFRTAQYCC